MKPSTPSLRIKGLWLVMDGRARFDVDEAAILEAMGDGVRDQVPLKAARRGWRDHDAVLCFAPAVDQNTVGPAEYVADL